MTLLGVLQWNGMNTMRDSTASCAMTPLLEAKPCRNRSPILLARPLFQ